MYFPFFFYFQAFGGAHEISRQAFVRLEAVRLKLAALSGR